MEQNIGVIGLGNMGGKVAERLLKHGYTVYVYDIDAEKRKKLEIEGAYPCNKLDALAENVSTIITSLPNGKILEDVLINQSLLEKANDGTFLIEISTTLPNTMDVIARKAIKENVKILDCPVSGGPNEVETGKLVLIIAGAKQDIDRCEKLLNILGDRQFYIGEKPGEAKAVKLVNNMMAMGNILIAAEAFSLGVKKGGLDPQRLYDILKCSGGASHQFVKRFPKVIDNDFSALATIEVAMKDLGLAIEWASSLDMQTNIVKFVRDHYEQAFIQGRGHEDMVSVYNLFSVNAGR